MKSDADRDVKSTSKILQWYPKDTGVRNGMQFFLTSWFCWTQQMKSTKNNNKCILLKFVYPEMINYKDNNSWYPFTMRKLFIMCMSKVLNTYCKDWFKIENVQCCPHPLHITESSNEIYISIIFGKIPIKLSIYKILSDTFCDLQLSFSPHNIYC